MKKIYILDTNILIDSAGSAIFGFDDNDVVITGTTIMELEKHKKDPGERGYNVRSASRVIKDLREKGNLYKGVPTGNGGTFRIEENGVKHDLPEWMLIMKGEDCIAVVTLTDEECVRSKLSKIAAVKM